MQIESNLLAPPVDSTLNLLLFAGVTNVLALADLYKEPIDGLSVDRVLQEITHKDMCHGAAAPTGMNAVLSASTRLDSRDKERLGILHYEELTGSAAAAAAASLAASNTRSCLSGNIVRAGALNAPRCDRM